MNILIPLPLVKKGKKMNKMWLLPLSLLLSLNGVNAAQDVESKKIGLNEINALIEKNRSVIIENLNHQIVSEKLQQQKSERLPEFLLGGDGYYSNRIPLASEAKHTNSLLYQFNIGTEFDVYTGGMHTYAIERMKKEQQMSEEKLKLVEEEVKLEAFVLLYDIHRNIKYKDFILSSIHLREKEYERIEQLYKNGLVLKSDLLRSKLYITDLQKDEVAITNSIDILSDKLCTLLGIDDRFAIEPLVEKDLNYKIEDSFEELFQFALSHSPLLNMERRQTEREETVLKEIKSQLKPHLKLYAQYGVGSAPAAMDFDHQLGGEVGAKLSLSLSSLYKAKHLQKAQRQRIEQQRVICSNEEEKLKNKVYELYTRYHESLINIDRAIEKIAMSKESRRILTNSYFNQQALLIDVLESETKSMEASFEWVEAVVDSQKYYWALKKICGYL